MYSANENTPPKATVMRSYIAISDSSIDTDVLIFGDSHTTTTNVLEINTTSNKIKLTTVIPNVSRLSNGQGTSEMIIKQITMFKR